MGSDEYSAPGYFSPSRFNLYRTGTLGHNTLSFEGKNAHCIPLQTYTCDCAASPFIVVNSTAGGITPSYFPVDAYAVVDLTDAFMPLNIGLQRVQRGIIIGNGRSELITVDEIDIATGAPDYWWSMHTIANISLSTDKLTATLSTWNVSVPVFVHVLPSATNCPGAYFNITSIDLQPPLLPSPGIFRLTLQAPSNTCTRMAIAVGLNVPNDVNGLRPLNTWNDGGGPLL